VLLELTIHDLAIIEKVRLSFAPGFNVMTGETGAGKSIIIDAVGLLLGGRAQNELIRYGTKGARVEGVFLLNETHAPRARSILLERGLVDEEEEDESMVILARELNIKGRNLCRINGQTVPLSLLRTVAAPLVDIHGQSQHLSLMNPRKHVNLLDRFAGTLSRRAEFAQRVLDLRRVREEMSKLASGERELAFRLDRLQYMIEEISAADLEADEEEELNREQRLLSNSEKLSHLATKVCVLLNEGVGDEQPTILGELDEVVRALFGLTKLDETVQDALEVGQEAFALLDDLARTVDRYRDTIEYNPNRLEEIDRRLSLIFNLKRKYGDTTYEILNVLQEAEDELDEIAGAEKRLKRLKAQEERLLKQLGTMGYQLSAARREAATRMARTVEQELEDLRMARAGFEVNIAWQPAQHGAPVPEAFEQDKSKRYLFDRTGLDKIEFLLAPNPGEGFKPLTRIASGGEASRIMLAIKTALGMADDTPTLIFDEIDTGVGGRVGNIVGQKLHGLSEGRQVLCITHLPQLAAFGNRHFHIRKEIKNDRTTTKVYELDEEARIAELAQMMGGGEAAKQAAAEMRMRV
jgi:DNA repair protein RecN (Recombination protein N)